MRTPVVCLIFNRVNTTRQMFSVLREVRPPILLIVADGPRSDYPNETEKCHSVRAIFEEIDWPCKVLKNYSDINLGCKRRVSSGLDWVFQEFEEAIILEDDCLPHPTFFHFCEELLERYRDDERVMHIGGNNFQFGYHRGDYSYYFSRYVHVWGWASWRRAWQHYDVRMKQWDSIKNEGRLQDILGEEDLVRYWTRRFDEVFGNEIDTWDYQWVLTCWLQSGLSVLPNVNLVRNVGFDQSATHTKSVGPLANLPAWEMMFPLKHPPFVIRDRQLDDRFRRLSGMTPPQASLLSRVANKLGWKSGSP